MANRLIRWKEGIFFLCPNLMKLVSIYRQQKMMNFGVKKKFNKIIYNEIIELK